MRGLSPNWLLGTETLHLYIRSDVLQGAVERYRDRTGRYPERVLADKIYRKRGNITYCKDRGIRLSEPALGRPKKANKETKKIEAIDNKNRIAVERAFSLAKRNYGLGLIKTKLDTTTRSSIALSIIAMNVEELTRVDFLLRFSIWIILRVEVAYIPLKRMLCKPLKRSAAY